MSKEEKIKLETEDEVTVKQEKIEHEDIVIEFNAGKYNFAEHEQTTEIIDSLENYFECDHCGEKLEDEKAKEEHEKEHLSKVYSEMIILVPKVDGKQVENPYECKVCKKFFKNGTNIKKHIRGVHLDIRAFKCSHCPAKFKNKSNLNVHTKRHLNTRNHLCSFCGQRFVASEELRGHVLRVHTKVKRFECDICGSRQYLKGVRIFDLKSQFYIDYFFVLHRIC